LPWKGLEKYKWAGQGRGQKKRGIFDIKKACREGRNKKERPILGTPPSAKRRGKTLTVKSHCRVRGGPLLKEKNVGGKGKTVPLKTTCRRGKTYRVRGKKSVF